jgi:hypothetical protein
MIAQHTLDELLAEIRSAITLGQMAFAESIVNEYRHTFDDALRANPTGAAELITRARKDLQEMRSLATVVRAHLRREQSATSVAVAYCRVNSEARAGMLA